MIFKQFDLSTRVASWVLCILGTMFMIVASLAIPFILPKFQSLFRDLGILLPALTTYAISLSEYNVWALILLLSLIHFALEFKYNGDRIRLVANVLYLALGLIMTALFILAIFLPLIKIVVELGKV